MFLCIFSLCIITMQRRKIIDFIGRFTMTASAWLHFKRQHNYLQGQAELSELIRTVYHKLSKFLNGRSLKRIFITHHIEISLPGRINNRQYLDI